MADWKNEDDDDEPTGWHPEDDDDEDEGDDLEDAEGSIEIRVVTPGPVP